MSIRAAIGSINEAERTCEVIFTTGAPVPRVDYWTGQRYTEVLSLKPEHLRLERLDSGAPLLDSHSAYSVGDVLGAVVPGSVRLEKKQGICTLRFSKRDAVTPIWLDVVDGIIRFVSNGYRTYKYEEETPKGADKIPIRTAIDWEPFEVSMVPMPADAGAKVRSDKGASNACIIVRPEPLITDADRLRRFQLATLKRNL